MSCFDQAFKNRFLMQDLFDNAADLELTLMVVPRKKLSIRKLQWLVYATMDQDATMLSREYHHRLSKSLEKFVKEDKEPLMHLQNFIGMFNTDRLMGNVKWVEGTRIVPETQFIFSTIEDGYLWAEAINPGPLKDQETSYLGVVQHPLMSFAVFDQFLGSHPIDRLAKRVFLENLKYILHGFTPNPETGEDPLYEVGYRKARTSALKLRAVERMRHFVTKEPLDELTPIPSYDDKDIISQFMPIIN